MEFLYNVFTVLHFVGWAIVLGGYLASMRSPGLYRGVFHGAATALVAGILMVGTAEMSGMWDDGGPSMAKIGVKLTVALIITVLAFVAKRQGSKADNGTGAVSPALKHTIGALTLVNIVVAVFW
ncbi:hypothetical protein BCE75_105167 [Isoptericola sp. CG 20/1183]|uniref:Integral membrane protein n=1 Tax=Isoptericola halotolerans TaxID=300560 RepID=A0ABX5EGS8_9MICO|nr:MULTISPECIES: hypothetical protein [Isoptericola]MCK0118078.1 hypothetical protein [Isoptericola sp. S6320L]PRZ06956.1 hypothetical protein BCL65_10596 [Isoptericola halotolerans]PRZ07372.1 hypothetical protein BCE75_105167 [Isoptericola sp. CG 20/1183]